jgi:hypothetical protein
VPWLPNQNLRCASAYLVWLNRAEAADATPHLSKPELTSSVEMEPMRYKHLLSQPELFQPAENTFFEINEGYESHGKILDEDIDNWVARKVREQA